MNSGLVSDLDVENVFIEFQNVTINESVVLYHANKASGHMDAQTYRHMNRGDSSKSLIPIVSSPHRDAMVEHTIGSI